MRRRFLGLLCIAFGFAGVANAQTLYGPGGLIINPTAYNDRAGLMELNASFFNRQPAGSPTLSFYPVSLTYAFTDRFELGALYVGERFDSSTVNRGGFFFKQGLMPETSARPAVAVVGTMLTGLGTSSTMTLIGSKTLPSGTRIHAGARAIDNSFASRLDGNLIAGVDFGIAKHYRFIAEGDTRLRQYHVGSSAFGIQYSSPAMVLTVGAIDQASGRYSFFVGAGYPVGKP
jgi:hypothetical protein